MKAFDTRIYAVYGAAILALSLGGGGGASAQSRATDDSIRLRNDCRLAAQVLRTGSPAPKREWAEDWIRYCVREAPTILTERWLSGAERDQHLVRLLDASSYVRDTRLANAAVQVIRTPGFDSETRVSAMVLLVRYINPKIGLAAALLQSPPGWSPGDPIRMELGGLGTHPIPQEDGEQRLADNLCPVTIELFRNISSTDADLRSRYVAGSLALRLVAECRP